MSNSTAPLLEVRNLTKQFAIKGGMFSRNQGAFRAVDDVSFSVPRGKTLGLVGESGSGKTTVGKCAIRLIEPTSGAINFDGVDLMTLSGNDLRRKRAEMQMIYQAPAASLNGRMTIGQIVAEPLWIHEGLRGNEAKSRVLELLDVVGLKEELYFRFPHEFSGGQQQRVGIARALAVNPRLLVLDEPTSALDVSVQAQVLNLLQNLQDEFDLTFLFISHDLSVVRHMCDEVALMYMGTIVEVGDFATIFDDPRHPYTQALISAIPEIYEDTQEEIIIQGELSTMRPGAGCPFAPRCHAAKIDACATVNPPLVDTGAGHQVACHLHPAGTS